MLHWVDLYLFNYNSSHCLDHHGDISDRSSPLLMAKDCVLARHLDKHHLGSQPILGNRPVRWLTLRRPVPSALITGPLATSASTSRDTRQTSQNASDLYYLESW